MTAQRRKEINIKCLIAKGQTQGLLLDGSQEGENLYTLINGLLDIIFEYEQALTESETLNNQS